MSLQAELAHYTGSEKFYRHGLARKVVYTEGVKHFADKAGAYWFLDILATEVYDLVRKGEEFVTVEMTVSNESAKIIAGDGNGKDLWSRKIVFTDCPPGTWKFYFSPCGQDGTSIIMLPSEY